MHFIYCDWSEENWPAEEMDILETTLSDGKSDIKKKDYSLSLLNASQNQTCDKVRRMSGNREAVIC